MSSFCYNGNMLEIFCAIYPEAKVLIQRYHLKKDSEFQRWDRFINAEQTIALTITGCGKINASSCVTAVLLKDENSFVLSFGSAAFLYEIPFGLYQADRICDIDTGIAYYPDLLIQTHCKECGFLTGSQLLSTQENTRMTIEPIVDLKKYLTEINLNHTYALYDTESSAIYHASNGFVGPHQMLFLRFPSDCDASQITAKQIEEKVESIFDSLDSMIQNILFLQTKDTELYDPFIKQFQQHIHASTTMCNQINQIIQYCKTIDFDYHNVIQELLRYEIQSKDDGKKVFHEFQRKCCNF